MAGPWPPSLRRFGARERHEEACGSGLEFPSAKRPVNVTLNRGLAALIGRTRFDLACALASAFPAGRPASCRSAGDAASRP